MAARSFSRAYIRASTRTSKGVPSWNSSVPDAIRTVLPDPPPQQPWEGSAGLVGLLIANAAASYNCTSCGKIPLSEFPEEFQSAVKRKRLFSVLGAIGVFIAVIALLFFMQSM